MRDPNHLREQARKCRTLAKTAIEPELIEPLRLWSVELADDGPLWSDAPPRANRPSYRFSPAQLPFADLAR
jgi:hypothetical protein